MGIGKNETALAKPKNSAIEAAKFRRNSKQLLDKEKFRARRESNSNCCSEVPCLTILKEYCESR